MAAKFRYEVEIVNPFTSEEWESIFKQAEFDQELARELKEGGFLEGIKNRLEYGEHFNRSELPNIYLKPWHLDRMIKGFEYPCPGVVGVKEIRNKIIQAHKDAVGESNRLNLSQEKNSQS